MFDLNPLSQPDAWWQHLIMLAVAALMGYIIGNRTSRGIARKLEAELAELEIELEDCRQNILAKTQVIPPLSTTSNTRNESVSSAPEPLDMIPVAVPSTPVKAGVGATPPIVHDDLKVLEGIGPKIEEILNKEGVLTFRQLSELSHERLADILRAAGKRFQIHDPGSWPRQAELAADGKWEELRSWQVDLNKGRTT